MFAQLNSALLRAQTTMIDLMIDLPDVNPDTDSPMAQSALKIVTIVFGFCAILAVLGIIVCGLLLVFGGVSPRVKEQATQGLIWSIVGTIVLGSAAGLTAWGLNFQVF